MRLLCILLFATTVHAAEVTRASNWELHSSFWMNLHQTLMHEASANTPRDLGALTPEQRTAWNAALAAYREAWGGKGDITFERVMRIAQDELSQVADDAVDPGLSQALAGAIKQAAPVYRAHWWPADDAANRFFIGYAAAMLRDAGDELARAHETVYGTPLPKTVRLDVTAHAGPYGAYTNSLRSAGPVTTMSSRDPSYQGHAVLEMVLHEASHTIVGPYNGTVARAIAASAKRLAIEPPDGLWHAVLFATSSQLGVRALRARGVTNYVPTSEDLLTRVWPQYRTAIETHWHPYVLEGKGTLDEAIDKVVTAVK